MKKAESRGALWFLVPSLLGVAVFFVLPFFRSFGYAVTDVEGRFVGLSNFASLFQNAAFRLAAANTVKFMAVAIPLGIFIPLVLGVMLFRLKGAAWLKTVFLSPLVIPAACAAFFFQTLFQSNGLVSSLLGSSRDWLQTDASFAIAVGVYLWKNMGYNLVLILAGLANIPKEYYECASVEGMGEGRMFFQITLVYMIPTLFIVFVMSFINSFKVFRELYMLSGSYPHEKLYLLQHYMNNQFDKLDYQNLTAASFTMTALIALLVIAFFRLDRKADLEEH